MHLPFTKSKEDNDSDTQFLSLKLQYANSF